MSHDAKHGYPNNQRFTTPDQGEAVESEYDLSSDELQDAITRNTFPFKVLTIDLSVAQVQPLEFNVQGRAICMFDYLSTDTSKAPTNTGLVNVTYNDVNDDAFPLRYKRGINGTYTRVYLSWPAAPANTKADIVFLRSDRDPWFFS